MANRTETEGELTVADFIEVLKQYPQDLPIRFEGDKTAEIWDDDEFYDGDPANPNCPIIHAIVIY